MMRSRPVQVLGFTLLALSVSALVLTQMFQCSVSTELVPADPRDFFDPSVHPLMEAIYLEGSAQKIESLLEANPEWATQPIYEGWYAVHCAGQAGRPDILRLLMDHGADIHALGGPSGANVIVSAFESDDPGTLEFVLDAGVDLHAQYPDGTPLEYIRTYGSAELNQVLDDRGLPKQSP